MAKNDPREIIHVSKKCPYCYAYLKIDASKCDYCKLAVGKVDKFGFAIKPTDWVGYIMAFLSIVAFLFFIWWGFFKEH